MCHIMSRVLGVVAVGVVLAGCPLTVTILPPEVVDAGAHWQLDGGLPQNSDVGVTQVPTGNHVVSFTAVPGWVTPPAQTVYVDNINPVVVTGTYTPLPSGGVMVTISPAGAVSAGARWSVDGGAPQVSGATVSGLAPGPHAVSFTDIAGWTKPPDQAVIVVAGLTSAATGTYTPLPPQTGALKVTIAPPEAVSAGGQWQVDGGAFQNSGATVTGLSPGAHTISFRMIQFWTRPANQVVTIAAGQTTSAIGTYSSQATTGAVAVTLQPAGARTAGAQWRVDTGMYHNSGVLVSGLPAGPHTISFAVAPGYVKPVSMVVNVAAGQTAMPTGTYTALLTSSSYVALAYNDLGMHCMNQDFSELMVLPPYNVFHATVIMRGEEPEILQEDNVSVSYTIPSNTTSVTKTNFWDYAQLLFGLAAPLPPDIGLTGNGLSGVMQSGSPEGRNDWLVTGIPITPIDDDGTENPYPLAVVTVSINNQPVVQTQNVVPVSWEMSCDLCHNTPGVSVATDILQDHDRLHGTELATNKPVVCGMCHGQPPLGLPGQPGRPTLSRAMHNAHANRMAQLAADVACYACHPGFRTQCQRDVHFMRGMNCISCHGTMEDVADPSRLPWQTEPRCGSCHPRSPRPGFEFEQPGALYRNSKGHHGVHCAACHGSPHAITPTIQPEDNAQAIALQGHAGPIDTCTVCHTQQPDDSFEHHK